MDKDNRNNKKPDGHGLSQKNPDGHEHPQQQKSDKPGNSIIRKPRDLN